MSNLKYGDLVEIKSGIEKGRKGFVEGVNNKHNIATVWFSDGSNIQGKTAVFLFESLRRV